MAVPARVAIQTFHQPTNQPTEVAIIIRAFFLSVHTPSQKRTFARTRDNFRLAESSTSCTTKIELACVHGHFTVRSFVPYEVVVVLVTEFRQRSHLPYHREAQFCQPSSLNGEFKLTWDLTWGRLEDERHRGLVLRR
jgi:hypothetical protein